MKYPLHFETYNVPNYFEKREAFNLIDFICSPMFLGFVAPVILLIFLPKLIPQGQEMQDAFQQANGALQQANNIFQPQFNLPDLTDICIRLFGGVQRQRQAD
jgi:hypothetical protein